MRKSLIFTSVFALTFTLALGITVMMTNNDALAIWQCSWECTFNTYVSNDFGDGVICDLDQYYVYKKSTCAGGPLNCPNEKWIVGCADPGFPFWRHIFPPIQIY